MRDREDDIRRGDAGCGLACQSAADHFGDQHRDRLAQRRNTAFDAAHAPADDAQSVDHGRVAVHADYGIRISDDSPVAFTRPYDAREIFEVDLVADAGARRDDPQLLERAAAPAQELVTLLVAGKLERHVLRYRVRVA